MKFLIKKTIIFIPNDGLYLFMSNTVDIKLSLIADRLLLLLINSSGEFISKQKIRDLLWQEYNVDASEASINNNLSFLRKSFKDLGIDNLIVTTPKVGVSLIQDVPIIVLEKDIQLLDKDMTENPEPVKDKAFTLLTINSLALFILVSMAIMVGFFLHSKKNENIYISTVNKCRVFSPATLSNTESKKLIHFVENYINSKSITCKENNIIVASTQTRGLNPMQTGREFFSLCEVNGDVVYSCASYYYLNGEMLN